MQWKFTPGIILLAIIFVSVSPAHAQVPTDSVPTSIDPELIELSNSKVPREYTISEINITGTKDLDEQLLVSISGLSVGDKVMYPGGDDFSKASKNLWKQNLFANVQIFFTKIQDGNIGIEINVSERPRLSKFIFKGTRKADNEELGKKTGLVKGRVVTENTKISAVQAIQKYYTEKGFQSAEVEVEEITDATKTNTVTVVFNVDRGPKVRINEVTFFGNENVSDIKLK